MEASERSTGLSVTEGGINVDQETKPTTSSPSSASSSSPPMKKQKLKKKEEKQRKLKAKFGIGGENAHNATTEDGKSPQCDFFLKKKNRYCALLAINNSPYCVFHQPQAQAAIVDFRSSINNSNNNCNPNNPSSTSPSSTSTSSSSPLPSEDENLLVPCPVDPRHQVRRKNVESHSKKCPFLARKKAEEARPFFHEDINLGSDDEKEDEEGGEGERIGKVSAIDRFTAEEFLEFRRKIEKAFQEIVTEKEGFPILHPSLPKPVEEPLIRQLNPSFNLEPLDNRSNKKHHPQIVSIIGHLSELSLLSKERYHYLELGAGKAHLTAQLGRACPGASYWIVDCGKFRYMGEKRYRTTNCERIRVDLKDCDPKGIQGLESKPVVALGKHLCGAGFDFGLRCCFRLFDSKSLQAIVVAQCCHHRCMWKAYPNKPFLKTIGITKREFPLLIAVCSWALCAMPKTTNSNPTTPGEKRVQEEEEEEEHERPTTNTSTGHSHPQHILELSSDEKEVLGFQCKRLLDMGRVLHLRGKGFESKLVYFVSQDISPENVLLVAFLPQPLPTEVTDQQQQLSGTSETSLTNET